MSKSVLLLLAYGQYFQPVHRNKKKKKRKLKEKSHLPYCFFYQQDSPVIKKHQQSTPRNVVPQHADCISFHPANSALSNLHTETKTPPGSVTCKGLAAASLTAVAAGLQEAAELTRHWQSCCHRFLVTPWMVRGHREELVALYSCSKSPKPSLVKIPLPDKLYLEMIQTSELEF